MGSNAGRPRLAVDTLKRNGTYRKDRHAERELAPRGDGEATCPQTVKGRGRTLWKSLVEGQLVPMGLATKADEPALELMCRLFSLLHEALKMAEVLPCDPAAKNAVATYSAAFDKVAGRFGYTPADRAKLTTNDKPDDDEFESLKRGKRGA